MMEEIRDFVSGQRPGAAQLNQTFPTVRSVQRITGGGGVNVNQSTHSTTISLDPQQGRILDRRLGVVVSQGPDGQADFTDARHWVQFCFVNAATYSDDVAVLTYKPSPTVEFNSGGTIERVKTEPDTVCVTNLAACPNQSINGATNTQTPNGTHVLTPGTPVEVFAIYDMASPQFKRWITFAASAASLPTGQHQYMNYQMTAQNQSGWDFTRAHPLI